MSSVAPISGSTSGANFLSPDLRLAKRAREGDTRGLAVEAARRARGHRRSGEPAVHEEAEEQARAEAHGKTHEEGSVAADRVVFEGCHPARIARRRFGNPSLKAREPSGMPPHRLRWPRAGGRTAGHRVE